MATKKPSSPKKPAESAPRITRIRTASTASADKQPAPAAPAASAAKPRRSLKGIGRPFVLIGGYFKGAWQELREVRWPNRRTTWSMTGALIAFTAFFVVLILLLDALFKYLFELILK